MLSYLHRDLPMQAIGRHDECHEKWLACTDQELCNNNLCCQKLQLQCHLPFLFFCYFEVLVVLAVWLRILYSRKVVKKVVGSWVFSISGYNLVEASRGFHTSFSQSLVTTQQCTTFTKSVMFHQLGLISFYFLWTWYRL